MAGDSRNHRRRAPKGFWFDATIFVALATVGRALVLLGTVGGVLLLRRWKGRRGSVSWPGTPSESVPYEPTNVGAGSKSAPTQHAVSGPVA